METYILQTSQEIELVKRGFSDALAAIPFNLWGSRLAEQPIEGCLHRGIGLRTRQERASSLKPLPTLPCCKYPDNLEN